MIEGEKGMRRSSDPNAHKQISLRLERDVAEGSCDVIIFESHCMFIFHLLRYGGAYDEELGTAVTLISRCFYSIIVLGPKSFKLFKFFSFIHSFSLSYILSCIHSFFLHSLSFYRINNTCMFSQSFDVDALL